MEKQRAHRDDDAGDVNRAAGGFAKIVGLTTTITGFAIVAVAIVGGLILLLL